MHVSLLVLIIPVFVLKVFRQIGLSKQYRPRSDTDQGFHCFPLIQQFSDSLIGSTFRKQAYSIILRILPPKNENFQIKNSSSYHISALNVDCGYSLEPPWLGSSNEYPQSVFKPGCSIAPFAHIFIFWCRKNKFLRQQAQKIYYSIGCKCVVIRCFYLR